MKKFLLLCFAFVFASFTIWAQDRVVSGKVTSVEDGSTLPGVNVVLKGTTNGSVTDADGNYKLSIPGTGGVLVFSYIGFKDFEVEVGDKTTIDVQLTSDVTQLSEVVVTALGVERQEKSLTYAVQSIDGSALSTNRETNFLNSLSGQIAGVQITNSSGAAGASTRVVLRGASTISGSNQPLFVVDGVPIDNTNRGTATSQGGFDAPNGASEINPDDIESINVLKGPVAAALYGNRGASGVIIITTKKGKASKNLGIDFSTKMTFQDPLRIPDFQNSYGQGPSRTYFEYVDGQNGYGDGVDESWGPPLDKGLMFAQWPDYGKGTVSPWVSRPNNVRDFYETGKTVTNSFAVSGGNEKQTFRFSVTDVKETGLVYNTDYRRLNISGNADIKINEKLDASFSANYARSGSDNLATTGYDAENPIQQTIWAGRNVDLKALKDYKNLPLAPEGTAAAGTPLNWNNIFQNNPYWVQDNNLNILDKDRVFGNARVGYKFTDWLSAFVRIGIDSWSSRTEDRTAVGSNNNIDGDYDERSRRFSEVNNFFMITANKKFGEIGLTVSAGGNQMTQNFQYQRGYIPALQLPGVYNLSNLKAGSTATIQNSHTEQKINSILGTAQISYRDAIFLDLSARNDWWSVLPIDNNSYLYPAASLSFVPTDFFDWNSTTLSYLKVRAGWSQVGSSGGLDPYSIQQVYNFRTPGYGDVLLAFNPNTLNNPNIKPETTVGLEFGLAAKLLNEKISFDFTYFDQTSKDLIVESDISPSSGYEKIFANIGEIQNRGVEIQLGYQIVKNSDLSASINVNFAKYNNQVIRVNDIDGDEAAVNMGGQWNVDVQAREGHPFGVLFGPGYKKDPNGNVIHLNGIPQIDTENYRVLGDIQPDWNGGISGTISYKGITLSSLVDVKMGGDVYSMTTTWGRYAGTLSETLVGREDGIIGKGVIDNGDGTYRPNDVSVTAEAYNKAGFSNDVAESSVFDASYVKWRQLTLTYQMPRAWFSKLPLKDVSVSFIGRNLALLYSKAPHIDPETGFNNADGNQGLEFGQIPSVRSLGFSVNIKL